MKMKQMIHISKAIYYVTKGKSETMTERQQHIFDDIINAYRWTTAEHLQKSKEEFTALWESWKAAAEANELSRIFELASLFFIAMYEFGEE